jgi:MSHA biogenesis protein MshJ
MIQRLQQIRERFDALSVRERLMVFAAVLAVSGTLWNLVVWKPIVKHQQNSVELIKGWQSRVKNIDRKISLISSNMTDAGQSGAMIRIKHLKDEIRSINEIKKDITVGFIRPKQIADVLKGILKKEPGLKLVRLQSLGVEPLFSKREEKNKKSVRQNASQTPPLDSSKEVKKSGLSTKPDIYKHGILLEFQGDYISTVNYLKKLESLPWKFYWDGMGYEVLEYPEALITINVFTLSLEKGWIGV